MILLRPDCLEFRTSDGEYLPCTAQQVTIELIGESASMLEEEVIENAAKSVLHYFKVEVGKTSVSVGEFAEALEKVLRGLGFEVQASGAGGASVTPAKPGSGNPGRVAQADLRRLASESDKGFELLFFARLREELRRQLNDEPTMLRFTGLRGCVKHLTGSRRWNSRCQRMRDQIITYVRECIGTEAGRPTCPVIVE